MPINLGNGSVVAASADIVLQNSALSSGFWAQRSTQDLASTLLHELGHVFNEVFGLGGSKILNDRNPDGSVNYDREAQNAKTLKACLP